MTPAVARLRAFFLPGDPGDRFAVFHPVQGGIHRGAVLYVHPFAEEMNKSRRMAALQARAFARIGYAVLLVDLFGCGDSTGDFVDARWEIWKRDLATATEWLERNTSGPVHLWGLRLGATLALECWQDRRDRYASAIIWQPVLQGEAFMTQFLRLALAGDVVRDSGEAISTERLRDQLRNGETIEIGGYQLVRELVDAIDRQSLNGWSIPDATVHWLEVRRTAGEMPASVRRTVDTWRSRGVSLTCDAVVGDAFWSSFDITEVPALIEATTMLYARKTA